MINFIICDDNEKIALDIKEIIDKFMMKNKTEYKTHLFNDLDDNFMREKKLVNNFMMNYDADYKITDFSDYTEEFFQAMYDETCFKIYLLDIQTDTNSGLNVARRIREEQDDWISIIIIITAFGEYRYEALGTRLYLLDFINKVYDCEDKIRDTLEIAMKYYDNRRKSLRFEYNYIMKNIEFMYN